MHSITQHQKMRVRIIICCVSSHGRFWFRRTINTSRGDVSGVLRIFTWQWKKAKGIGKQFEGKKKQPQNLCNRAAFWLI